MSKSSDSSDSKTKKAVKGALSGALGQDNIDALRQAELRGKDAVRNAALATGLVTKDDRTFVAEKISLSSEQIRQVGGLRTDLATGTREINSSVTQLQAIARPVSASGKKHSVRPLEPLNLPEAASPREQLTALKAYYAELQKMSENAAMDTIPIGGRAVSALGRVDADLSNLEKKKNIDQKALLPKIVSVQNEVGQFERAAAVITGSQDAIRSAGAVITALESEPQADFSAEAVKRSILALQQAANQVASQLRSPESNTPPVQAGTITATLEEARAQQGKIAMLKERAVVEREVDTLQGQLKAEARHGGGRTAAITGELDKAKERVQAISRSIADSERPAAVPAAPAAKSTTSNALDQIAPTVLSAEAVQAYQQDKQEYARHTAMFKRAIYDALCEKAIIANAVASGQVDRPKDMVDSVISKAAVAGAKVLPMGAAAVKAGEYLANYHHNAVETRKHQSFAAVIPAGKMNEIAETLASTMSYQMQEGASKITEVGLQQLAGVISAKIFEGAGTINQNRPLQEQLTALAYASSAPGISTLVQAKDASVTLSGQAMLEEVGIRTEDGKCYGTDRAVKYGFRHGTEAELKSGNARYVSLGYSREASPHNISAEAARNISLEPKTTDIDLEGTLEQIKQFKVRGTGLGEGSNRGDVALFKRASMSSDLKEIVEDRLKKDGFIIKANDPEAWKRYVSKADVAAMLETGGRDKVLAQKGVNVEALLVPRQQMHEPDRLDAATLNAGLRKLEQYGKSRDSTFSDKEMRKSLQKIVNDRRQETGDSWRDHVTPADVGKMLETRKLGGITAGNLMQMTGLAPAVGDDIVAPAIAVKRPSFGEITTSMPGGTSNITQQQQAAVPSGREERSTGGSGGTSSLSDRARGGAAKLATSGLGTKIQEDIGDNVKGSVISATLGDGLMGTLAGNVTTEQAASTARSVGGRAAYQAKKLAETTGLVERDSRKFSVDKLPSLTEVQVEKVVALRRDIQQNSLYLQGSVEKFQRQMPTQAVRSEPTALAPLEFPPKATPQEQLTMLRDYYTKLGTLSQQAGTKVLESGRDAIGAAEKVDNDLHNLSNNRTEYVDHTRLAPLIRTAIQESEGFERGIVVVEESRKHISDASQVISALQTGVDRPTEASWKAIEALRQSANQLSEQLQETVAGRPPAALSEEAATGVTEARRQQQKVALLAERGALEKQKAGLQGELKVEEHYRDKAIAEKTAQIQEKQQQIDANTRAIAAKEQEVTAKRQPAIAKEREVAAQAEKIASTSRDIKAKQEAITGNEGKIQAAQKTIGQKEIAKGKAQQKSESIAKQSGFSSFIATITTFKSKATRQRMADEEVKKIGSEIGVETAKVSTLGTEQEKLRSEEKALASTLPQLQTQLGVLKEEHSKLEAQAAIETKAVREQIAGLQKQSGDLQKEQAALEKDKLALASGGKVAEIQREIAGLDGKISAVAPKLEQIDRQTVTTAVPVIDTSRSKALNTALGGVEKAVLSSDAIETSLQDKEEHARQTSKLKRAIYESFCEKAIVAHAINTGKVERPQDVVDGVLMGVSAAGIALPIAAPAISAGTQLAKYAYDKAENQKYATFAQAIPAGKLNEIAEAFASKMSHELQEVAGSATDRGIDQLAAAITTKIFEEASKIKANKPPVEQLAAIAYAPSKHLVRATVETRDASKQMTAEGMLERVGIRDENGNCYSAGREEKYGFRLGTAEEVKAAGSRLTKLDYSKAPGFAMLSKVEVSAIELESKPTDIYLKRVLEDIKDFKAPGDSKGLGRRANESANQFVDMFNKAQANIVGQGEAELFKEGKMREDLSAIVTARLGKEGFTLKENDVDGWERYVQKEDVAQMLKMGGRAEVLERKGVSIEEVMRPQQRAVAREENVIPEATVNTMLDNLKRIGVNEGKHGVYTHQSMEADLKKIVKDRMKADSIPRESQKGEWKRHVTPEDIQTMLENPKRAVRIPPHEMMQMVDAAPVPEVAPKQAAPSQGPSVKGTATAVVVEAQPIVVEAQPVAVAVAVAVEAKPKYVPRDKLDDAMLLMKTEGKAVVGKDSHAFDRHDTTLHGKGVETDLRKAVTARVNEERAAAGEKPMEKGDKESWKGLVTMADISAVVQKRAPEHAATINANIERNPNLVLQEVPQRRDLATREVLGKLTGDREIWTPEQRAERVKMAEMAKAMGTGTGAKGGAREADVITKGQTAITAEKAAAQKVGLQQ